MAACGAGARVAGGAASVGCCLACRARADERPTASALPLPRPRPPQLEARAEELVQAASVRQEKDMTARAMSVVQGMNMTVSLAV